MSAPWASSLEQLSSFRSVPHSPSPSHSSPTPRPGVSHGAISNSSGQSGESRGSGSSAGQPPVGLGRGVGGRGVGPASVG